MAANPFLALPIRLTSQIQLRNLSDRWSNGRYEIGPYICGIDNVFAGEMRDSDRPCRLFLHSQTHFSIDRCHEDTAGASSEIVLFLLAIIFRGFKFRRRRLSTRKVHDGNWKFGSSRSSMIRPRSIPCNRNFA